MLPAVSLRVGMPIEAGFAHVHQPVTGLERVYSRGINPVQRVGANHPEHDVGQVPRRVPHLGALDRPFPDHKAGLRGDQVVTTSTTLGVVVAMPSSRPAVSAETTTESAPDWRSRRRFSDSRTAATIRVFGASSRAVSVTSTAVSSRFVATTIAVPDRPSDPQHARPGRVAGHRHQPLRGRGVKPTVVRVNHNDVGWVGTVSQQRLHRGSTLGAVADHNGVVTHRRLHRSMRNPPRSLRQQLHRGADSTIRNTSRSGVMTSVVHSRARR